MINKDTLKQIGLTDYEAEVYLALLANGQISAYELAEKAGLYRQVTYDSLKRLVEKGFVSSVIECKTKLFKATDPNLILELINEKTESYKQMLPELTKLYNTSKQPLMVETYKGKNIVRIALRDIINNLKESGGEVLCTAVDESVPFSKYKKIQEKFFNENPIQIYKNNVQIIVWGNPDYLIIIRNKGVAEAYRKQFEFMWKIAKK